MRQRTPSRSQTLIEFITEDKSSIIRQDARYDATPYEVLATYREMLAEGFALVRSRSILADGSADTSGWSSLAACIEAHDLCEARDFNAAIALLSANPGQVKLADAIAQLKRGRD